MRGWHDKIVVMEVLNVSPFYSQNVYPWKSGSSNTHYFVEFDSPESAKRVRGDFKDISIQHLSSNPDMVKRFREAASSPPISLQQSRHGTKRAYEEMQEYTPSPGVRSNYARSMIRPRLSNEGSSSCQSTPSRPHQLPCPMPLSSYGTPQRHSGRDEYHPSEYSNGSSRAATFAPYASPLARSRHTETRDFKFRPPVSYSDNLRSNHDMTSTTANVHASPEYNPSFPQLLLPVKPESVTLNYGNEECTSVPSTAGELQTMDDATKTIATLKSTFSNLGEWMMAAARYRRDGRHEAALEVANALVDGAVLFHTVGTFWVFN